MASGYGWVIHPSLALEPSVPRFAPCAKPLSAEAMPPFDCPEMFPYNQAMVDAVLPGALKSTLIERQLPAAGWSYGPALSQPALEPTCLALLALRWDLGPVRTSGLKFLLGAQNPNGSWPAFTGDDREGSGLTALAVIALINNAEITLQTERALRWLLSSKGRESHWLWKWKFQTCDTHVRFDPNKFGWPWMSGSCSWVIPTGLSMIALKQAFVCCRTDRVSFRIRRGVEMLLDRACPGGGWNAGNGLVYGVPLAPHLDATSIALLALCREKTNDTIAAGLGWLERTAANCLAPWSLAWSILALDAYDRPIAGLADRLRALKDSDLWDSATLALVTLALDCSVQGNAFKVVA